MSLQRVLLFLVAHIPLAAAMKLYPLASTAHAAVVLALGLRFALVERSARNVVLVSAYIVGSELLWRGTGARIPWEFGKYAVVLLCCASMATGKAFKLRRAELLPVAYWVCLLPSLMVLPYFDRTEIAFNLSGPLCLAVATLYCSTLTIKPPDLRSLLVAMLGPVVGLVFLTIVSTVAVTDPTALVAGGKETTAGIGPNQVSSVLSIGILCCFFLLLLVGRNRPAQLLFGSLIVVLATQTLLSLSRGGLWTALGSIAVAVFFLTRSARIRRVVFPAVVLLGLLFSYVVFPGLDSYTGGVVRDRFTSTELTGRDKIIEADWLTFQDHPTLGVGPGQSPYYHDRTFRYSASHTEYSRLLAEHGAFGVAALLLLTLLSWRRVRRRTPAFEKALILSFVAWSLLFQAHAAMRLAAPAFLFALAAARYSPDRRATSRRRSLGPVSTDPPRPPQPLAARGRGYLPAGSAVARASRPRR